jgi:transposase-like protein
MLGGDRMSFLNDIKLRVIEDLAEGIAPKTQIANKHGIARQTIYDWLDNVEFKAELDRRLQQRKVWVEKKIDGHLDFATDQVFEMIRTTKNERVKSDLLRYVLDRGLGKTTTKVEFSANMNENRITKDILEEEHEKWLKEIEEDDSES